MLAPWKKSYNSVLKSRDIILLTKVYIVKAVVFPVFMHRCESWTIKKPEHQRSDSFELWYCPLDSKEIKLDNPKRNQPLIFTGRTDAEAEASIFWPPDAKSWLIWRDPMQGRLRAGGQGVNIGWDGCMVSSAQWTWVQVNSGRWWRRGKPGVLPPHGVAKSWTRLSNWTARTKKAQQERGLVVWGRVLEVSKGKMMQFLEC